MDASDTSHAVYSMRTVDRVCDILDSLPNSSEGISLAQVAQRTDLHKSSALRYLSALEARGYVHRDRDNGTYRLGLAFRTEDARAVGRLSEFSTPILMGLRDAFRETTNLGTLEGAYVSHQVIAESRQMMRLAARVGERGYLHSTALGKAICSTLPEDTVRSMLTLTGMPTFTTSTITNPDAYLHELDRVRDLGFAVDDEENQLGGRCIAVSVPRVELRAAISMSAPASRFPREKTAEIASLLRSAARSLSRSLRS